MEAQIKHYENKLAFEMDPSDLFDAFNNGDKVIALDARKAFGFEAEHIPNAINIPHREMTVETTKHLDRDILYVTYCDGIGCNASTKGALNMAKLGFKVKEVTFNLNKLLEADEVLITNSLFGVMQVKKIKNRSWQHQESASLFNQLLENLNS